ncbi:MULTISPECIES: DUF4334 domain-containing protein [Nocardia]|uniref:GXWXG protein n=2 Tax=Nocardia TaxID=1817 RepID=A0A4R6P553_NOCIG|nr:MULTISPECIES: DUF4334 domain-containing protein [Nocardia]MCA2207499.1 DUF4334 domain-containing protein [Nocardia rosealba]NKX86315.1 DUF4334 domain-containing protein [Nocardia coubleae]TDP32964.1 GXWXG protein [Nocardia ignorata]
MAEQPRWQQLRAQNEGVSTAELDEIWTRLRPARAEDILGQWRGDAFQTGHRLCKALPASRWYGKTFLALDDAKPLICRAEDGTLFSNVEMGQGEATLWNIEFRGEVTATMVYDGRPVFDHFKWLDDNTLMGIMNGRPELVLAGGQYFYFLLERDS